MNCPVCSERLREIERLGIIFEFCPSCKGAWLEQAQLERLSSLLNRESRPESVPEIRIPEYRSDEHDRYRDHRHDGEYDSDDNHQHRHKEKYDSDDHYGGHDNHGRYGHKRRRGGLLDNLMDMFGD